MWKKHPTKCSLQQNVCHLYSMKSFRVLESKIFSCSSSVWPARIPMKLSKPSGSVIPGRRFTVYIILKKLLSSLSLGSGASSESNISAYFYLKSNIDPLYGFVIFSVSVWTEGHSLNSISQTNTWLLIRRTTSMPLWINRSRLC